LLPDQMLRLSTEIAAIARVIGRSFDAAVA
jgi:hypothetical protein